MLATFILFVVVCVVLAYFGVPAWAWAVGLGGFLVLVGAPWLVVVLAVAVSGFFAVVPLRRKIFSRFAMSFLDRIGAVPQISDTEKIAIEAGDTWVEKELFSGKIHFQRVFKEPWKRVNNEEQAFLKEKVDHLCSLVDDWAVFEDRDFPKQVWDYLKAEKFFGMIIPKKYGGLEFSAKLNSEVVSRLTSRSVPLAITVMVPNSLGPAELLLHYGTEEQKNYYLPRLADGREIPCFGLTELEAGSDAGSIQSKGEVFQDKDDKLYIRLNWSKRYITLGSVATTIGLAIKLEDPNNLLGKGKKLGITCMLVDAKLPGVELSWRHDPLGVPFYNCPIVGKDVVVSVDQIIGGVEWAGKGWQMLMECLAVGRAISLPAQGTGMVKLVARLTGAYAQVRQQFRISIGEFEGISEQLAHIGGIAYLIEAMRIFTVGAVDSGLKPAVVSAMSKYLGTEMSRDVLNRGMDVLGGAGISCGPRNLLAHPYMAAPIGITVEGANILTRTMIIFGQGALRCHPYAAQELFALADKDLKKFDHLFARHIRHVIRNKSRAFVHSLTRGHLILGVPRGQGYAVRRYYQKLAWVSSTFAFWADVAMGVYGGGLKFRESITGRFADIFNHMYLVLAALRRFEEEGRKKEHRPALDYAVAYCFVRIQKSFEELFYNFEMPVFGWFVRGPLLWWTRANAFALPPSDKTKKAVAKMLQSPSAVRDDLTVHGLYLPPMDQEDAKGGNDGKKKEKKVEALVRMEKALLAVFESKQSLRKIKKAMKSGKIPKENLAQSFDVALEKGVITQAELEQLQQVEGVRADAVAVDAFTLEQYKTRKMKKSQV